jgi:hypothetical protein
MREAVELVHRRVCSLRSIRRNLDGYQLQRAIAIRTARLGLLVLAILQYARDFPMRTSPFVDAARMRSAVWMSRG